MPLENDTLTALEAARMKVIAGTEQAHTAAKDAARMSEDARNVTSTVASVGGEVSVRASADGSVESVDVSAASLDLDERTLSRLLTDTVRRAQRKAADAAIERMARTLGDASPLVASSRARVEEQFGHDTEIR